MAEFDVVVLGGGPAGVQAAVAAVSAGLKVALFDDNASADGRFYRVPGAVDQLAASSVSTFFAHQVWAVSADFRVDAVGPQGALQCTTRALVVATGTTELIVPFEGWTTPGVIGLGAAMAQLQSQGRLPGQSVVVAGCGPWVAAVAAMTIESGGIVEAIVDLAACADRASTVRRTTTQLYGRHLVVRVEPMGGQLGVTMARCDADGRLVDAERTRVLADCVVVGHGFVPSTDTTRLLGAQHSYSRAAGGWIATADQDGRTSRARLYVAGDCAGVAGGAAAAAHGTLAGLVCALDLGAANPAQLERAIESARGAHYRAKLSAHAMAAVMALLPAHIDGIPGETTVCRCEGVSRAAIDAACDIGARDMNQLKAWTRCGMGPCQGRLCGDIAAELLTLRTGAASREAVGSFSARTPLRPIAIEALTGVFQYDDINFPTAAQS